MHGPDQRTIFDAIAAGEAAEAGIAIAAKGNDYLTVGRQIAVRLARANGRVTADDVIREMIAQGYAGTELGNAAGGLFKKGFRQIDVVKCERVASHGRLIRVWVLK